MVNLCVLLLLLRFNFTTGCFCCSSLSFLRVQFSFCLTLYSPAQATHNLRPTKHILFILNWFNFCVTLSVAVLTSNHPPYVFHHFSHHHCCCCPPLSTFHLSSSAHSLEIGEETHTLIFYFWSRLRMKYKFSWMFNWLFMRWFRAQDENLSWW